jgi:sigma54-dependent transcription regulator
MKGAGKRRDAVLVSWISHGEYAAPLITALDHASSPLLGRVHTLYLFVRVASGADGEKDSEVLAKTRRDLKATLGPVCPRIEVERWRTEAPPTDHAAIRDFAERTLRKVREAHPEAPIYIQMSPGTPAMHAVWLVLGSTGFLDGIHLIQTTPEKFQSTTRPPVVPVDLALDTWLRRYRRARPTTGATEDDGQLWDPRAAKSPALRTLFDELRMWAPLDVPVLLSGERGAGKTTIANLLRATSPFQREREGGWSVVVCGQFSANPELARSELFGHVKGAFTGATADRTGLLESADGDTLFLDEIAHIDRQTQHLLLAAIEGRGFSRLGESRVRHARFRIVAATNRPLDELRSGVLEPDFYDRLAVAVVNIPPLRECREDIPAAWSTVLRRAARRVGVPVDGWEAFLDHEALVERLSAHDLPGNFRTLQRVAFHILAARSTGANEEACLAAAGTALASASGPVRPVAEPSPRSRPARSTPRSRRPVETSRRPRASSA